MAGKSKSWTPERRAKQSQWMKENRPWEKSTGPRTTAGKEKIKQNALKHGMRSIEAEKLRALLAEQAALVRRIQKKNGDFSLDSPPKTL